MVQERHLQSIVNELFNRIPGQSSVRKWLDKDGQDGVGARINRPILHSNLYRQI